MKNINYAIKNSPKVFMCLLIISLALFSFFSVQVAVAQADTFRDVIPGQTDSDCPGDVTGGVGIPNPLKGGCSLYALVEMIINNVILPIGGVIVVFMTIYSGFLLVTAGGNEEKLKVAKKNFVYTLMGAAVLLGAWVIALGVKNTLDQIRGTSTSYSSEKSIVIELSELINNQA